MRTNDVVSREALVDALWGYPDGAKTWGEIVEFASAELGPERADELRRQGAELPLDEFTASLR